jgi:DNA-binding transcriptional LysR family regulator
MATQASFVCIILCDNPLKHCLRFGWWIGTGMQLNHLRAFVAAADDLHFGRAARALDLLPSALGRQIKLLEADLGTRLFVRTTRRVGLTAAGAGLLDDARRLVLAADTFALRARIRRDAASRTLRIGAIDTAAVGLVPHLLREFRRDHAAVTVQLIEDKSARLLPRLLSGALDVALVRPPPEQADKRLMFRHLLHETPVVAVPHQHALAKRKAISIAALAGQPLIVPDRRSRPHSHDLTVRLFAAAGIEPTIAQIAEEKQTIVTLVGAGLGLAIVPKWTAQGSFPGVRFRPLSAPVKSMAGQLPLAIAWARGTRDPLRNALLAAIDRCLVRVAAQA